jgi:hypothetical protein
MADVDFEGLDRPAFGARAGRIVQIGAAVVSLALVAGIALWGYRLAVRDVAGVPVVRAMEGPMRIAPDDPGGEVAAHQGLAVNDVAADGAAAGPADRLTLAPATAELAEEDAAGTMAAPVADTSARSEANAGLMLETDGGADAAAIELAVADAVNLSGSLDATGAPAPGARTLLPLPAGFVRPMPKPVWLGGAAVPAEPAPQAAPDAGLSLEDAPAAPAAVTPATAPVEIDPATLQPGTRLVQLGAFETQDLAREEWLKLAARFGDLMAGKGRVIEAAQSGGRTFFRLRAHGFETETEARRFCAAFLSEQTACIPVTQR